MRELKMKSSTSRTLGGSLARELTAPEQAIVAGGSCFLTYPPVTGYACDPHEH